MGIKLLIVGDSPILATGMGETIRLIFRSLLDRYPEEYEIHQLALAHTYAIAAPRWPVYPTKGMQGKHKLLTHLDPGDLAGEKTFPELVHKLQPEIVFAFNDPQRVLHLCSNPSERTYRLVLYINFDGFPFPADGAAKLKRADLIVTMSEFSRCVLLASMHDLDRKRVAFMYAPADVDRFKPLSGARKLELREKVFPLWMARDSFVLGWVGRNQWRKQVWILYEVIGYLRSGNYFVCERCGRVTVGRRRMAQRVMENQSLVTSTATKVERVCGHCSSRNIAKAEPMADLFLWMHMIDEASNDWKKSVLENHYGLRRGQDIHYTEDHKIGSWKSPAEMQNLYAVWDGLLYLSGGEGFGLPAWEAMCSGIPVVYTNYSSHAEFLNHGQAGLPVGGILQPEARTCILRMIADIGEAIEAVRKLYFGRELGGKLGENGQRFVLDFAAKRQAARWHELFKRTKNQAESEDPLGGFE